MGLARCDEIHSSLSAQEAEAGAMHISEASHIVSSKPARGTYEDPVKQGYVHMEVIKWGWKTSRLFGQDHGCQVGQ